MFAISVNCDKHIKGDEERQVKRNESVDDCCRCAVKPSSVTLTGLDGTGTEGTAVVVYCVAEGARPAATVTWSNDSSPLLKSAVETIQLQVLYHFCVFTSAAFISIRVHPCIKLIKSFILLPPH